MSPPYGLHKRRHSVVTYTVEHGVRLRIEVGRSGMSERCWRYGR